MILGIILSSGESLVSLAKSGQDVRFKRYYIDAYSKKFEKVYIFTYKNETTNGLPKNVFLIPNKYNLHRFLYGILLPFLNVRIILKCDIIRTYHLLGTVPAILSKLILRRSYVFNYGYDYKKFALVEKKYFQYLLLTLIRPIANSYAAKILVMTKDKLYWTPKKNTVYIPNGVDINIFKPNNKLLNTKKIKILNVGRIEEQKNQRGLIMAISSLDYELTIVGNGNLKLDLIKLAKENNVKLKIIDKIENIKMPQMYNKFDIFILSSIIEGSVKVLLEAMSCGLPIICTKTDIVAQIIKDHQNGIYCSPEPSSIRKSLIELIKNKKLMVNIAKNARYTIVSSYDIREVIKKEIKVLKEVGK